MNNSLLQPTDEELASVVDLLNKAGERLLDYWPGATKPKPISLEVELKADGTPVSEADYASNEILVSGLQRLFPDDAIISEELPYPDSHELLGRRTWIIDPLDGTKSFVAGRDDFSILVGLVRDHKPCGGFMYFPALKKFVWSVGTTNNFANAPLRVSSNKVARNGAVYFAKLSEISRPELGSPPMDSGLAYLNIARGELDGLIIRMESHREWDIASPAWIIIQAGGRITNELGDEIRFGIDAKPCEFCVASNGLIHNELLSLIAQ